MWLILVLVTLVFGVVAGGYAWMVFLRLREGTIDNERIVELSGIIHKGAMAFLKKEYTWLAPFVGVVALLLWWMLDAQQTFFYFHYLSIKR